MPIVPLYGHGSVRARLGRAVVQGELPAALLLHGCRGVGKQRLALWLAQLLLCERRAAVPCGHCAACRAVVEVRHPDLYWFYPRPRLKTPDPTPADVLDDYVEGRTDRLERHGLYAPPSGSDGLYVATIRTIVQRASLAPAMGARKVFVVGDAERMVSQEGADQAANAFLKLLEEPPADTTIVLTSSEPGALLPTVRSRVVAFRCARLTDAEVREWLGDPAVQAALDALDVPPGVDGRVAAAAGVPGELLGRETRATAMTAARELITAAARGGAALYATALAQGAARARGSFSDILEALYVVLRERARDAVAGGDRRGALGASRAVDAVARAQRCADGNVNPQLVAARLLRELTGALG